MLCGLVMYAMLTLSYSLIWYMHTMLEPLVTFDLVMCDKLLLICILEDYNGDRPISSCWFICGRSITEE